MGVDGLRPSINRLVAVLFRGVSAKEAIENNQHSTIVFIDVLFIGGMMNPMIGGRIEDRSKIDRLN
jgi:hypothetical protein